MRSLKFLRTAPGAALLVAILATTGASAYALTNWFNGNVSVNQKDSVLSVDISQCRGNLPAGIEPTADKHNVQFKILDSKHISASDLQQQLLVNCEYQAVVDFYRQSASTKDADTHTGIVKSINGDNISLTYLWGGKTHQKSFTLTSKTTFYDKGVTTNAQNLQPNDTVVFVTPHQASIIEGTDPLTNTKEIQSIFKTQYDTSKALSASKNGFYSDNNIMPMDLYNKTR